MPSPGKAGEEGIFKVASNGLKLWLQRARDAVMAPFKQFGAQPNPAAIYATVPFWEQQVDRILQVLTPAQREGWAAASLPRPYDPADPFIQANLALTKNLLVNIPKEVHSLVVREILEGTNAGETLDQIANRVDNVLTYTGSENWPARARLIAQTETTRHFSGSMLAHAFLVENQDKKLLMKQWNTTMDDKERTAHRLANNQVRTLNAPFDVGGESLLFPGDPSATPANVCNCRCNLRILDVTP